MYIYKKKMNEKRMFVTSTREHRLESIQKAMQLISQTRRKKDIIIHRSQSMNPKDPLQSSSTVVKRSVDSSDDV